MVDSVSGFTLVRNAVLLNYPFVESVRSILPLCDELVINCGDSDDNTEELCAQLQKENPGKIKLLHSKWDRGKHEGGKQLREQTDFAMRACKGEWCFYIQADEVVHQKDLENVREAIEKAKGRPKVDGLVFDYLHFYVGYNYTIRGRNWYRREIRVFKNHQGITSFRDAQGFRLKGEKLKGVLANARIFHYGYVRNPESLKTKETEMSRWWGKRPEINPQSNQPVRHVGLSKFTETHPEVMREKIERENIVFDPSQFPRRWNSDEIKNALTLLWETFVPIRIGEFRNFDLVRP